MLNCSAIPAVSTCILKALPGKLDIKIHSPSILYYVSKRNDISQKESVGQGYYALKVDEFFLVVFKITKFVFCSL